MRPDFGSVDDLRTFLRIVDSGSLSAAAEEDRLSVNAVSQRLQKLEARLGVKLLSRTTRRARPTDEGLRFAERCRRALHELDEAARELAEEDRGLGGRVSVTVQLALLHTGVIESLSAALLGHPQLSLELRATLSLEGQPPFDVALWLGEVPLQSLIVRRMGRMKVALAASPAYAAAYGLPQTPDDLARHECLRALKSPRERQWVLVGDRGKKLTVPVGGRFEADDAEALRQAILGGIGIGLRPREEVLRGVRDGSLVHVLPGWGFDPPAVSILSPPERLKVARVQVVAEALERAARVLG